MPRCLENNIIDKNTRQWTTTFDCSVLFKAPELCYCVVLCWKFQCDLLVSYCDAVNISVRSCNSTEFPFQKTYYKHDLFYEEGIGAYQKPKNRYKALSKPKPKAKLSKMKNSCTPKENSHESDMSSEKPVVFLRKTKCWKMVKLQTGTGIKTKS